MLLFIGTGRRQDLYGTISKHRMLLFIKQMYESLLEKINFKTSYVTVYLHLLDIQCSGTLFQNIVCYCLSKSRAWQKSSLNYFKTSYVTVYLMILSHFPISYFHYFLYFTPFRHFLPASYQIYQFRLFCFYCLVFTVFSRSSQFYAW